MLVFYATPLIYLATVDQLEGLNVLDEPCTVPQLVYDEVVTESIESGHVDARRVEQAVESGILSVRPTPETELPDRLRENPNLTEADVAVIALAASENGVAMMDDRYGRATADTEGVETSGTAAILGEAVRDGQLAGEEAIDILDAMIDAGWYCSTDLYTRIVRSFRGLDESN